MKTLFRQVKALVKLSFLELWRRNDMFVLIILALALSVPLLTASPFGAKGATRYFDEAALLMIWAFSVFIAVGTGSRLFPPEFESRTIYPLLSKPISRGRLVVGKYFGAVAASASSLILFYALFAGAALLHGSPIGWDFFQAVVLHLAFVALAVAISLVGSLIVTPSANVTLTSLLLVTMFFFGRKLPVYAASAPNGLGWLVNAVYAVAPHTEFFDMRQRLVHGWGCVDGAVFVAALAYATGYVLVCLFVASRTLARKRI